MTGVAAGKSQLTTPETIAAYGDAWLHLPATNDPRCRMDSHDTTAGVAIKAGAGPTQDFDSTGCAQVDVAQLRLTIWCGQWNAVEQDFQAPHAK
mgnify:CR=1 FL=1